MSMKSTCNDLISPDLAKKAAAMGKSRDILQAGAEQLVNITKRAFRDPALRPAVWRSRKSDEQGVTYDERGKRRNAQGKVEGHPLLLLTGQLLRSIHVQSVSNTLAVVAASHKTPKGGWNLAAIHQYGAPRANIPPRPFFPFIGGQMTPVAKRKVGDVMQAKCNRLLGIK